VIDASGMLLLPGGIDVHTHLDMPFGGTTSSDDFETGTRAAAFGGTTTLIDFAIQARGMKMRDALDIWWKKAENRASIDYGLHMIVTDLYEAGLEDMDAMVAEGVASFKLFMAYPGVLMVDDATIFKALSQSARNGALICMHAENGGVIDVIVRRALAEGKTAPIYHALTRPATAEAEAVHRAIALAEMAGAPVYIVHLSSEDALNQVREARDRGLPAFAETCPQYLLLSMDDLARPGFEGAKYVFTPPLREKRHQPKLWDGLKNDHLAGGLHRPLPVLFRRPEVAGQRRFHQDSQWRSGHRKPPAASVSLRRERGPSEPEPLRGTGVDHAGAAVRPLSAQRGTGARQRRRYRRLGPAAGAHHRRRTHHMRVDYSMFEGFRVKGNARMVLSRGEVIVDGERHLGRAGRGQFLKRAARGGAMEVSTEARRPISARVRSTTKISRRSRNPAAIGASTTTLRCGWG
jgi:dihydropyrimidinase